VLTTAVAVLKKNMGTIAVERFNPNSAACDDLRPGSACTGPHGRTQPTKIQHHPKGISIPPLMLMSTGIE
jgi:hypothetical protein